MSETDLPAKTEGGLGELQTDLLAGTSHIKSDLRMVQRAIRERWPIAAEKRPAVVERLMEVVDKRECTVMTKDGPESLDGPADSNAISAARSLIAMDALNQADEHIDEKNKRLDEGKATERIEGVTMNVVGPSRPQGQE